MGEQVAAEAGGEGGQDRQDGQGLQEGGGGGGTERASGVTGQRSRAAPAVASAVATSGACGEAATGASRVGGPREALHGADWCTNASPRPGTARSGWQRVGAAHVCITGHTVLERTPPTHPPTHLHEVEPQPEQQVQGADGGQAPVEGNRQQEAGAVGGEGLAWECGGRMRGQRRREAGREGPGMEGTRAGDTSICRLQVRMRQGAEQAPPRHLTRSRPLQPITRYPPPPPLAPSRLLQHAGQAAGRQPGAPPPLR